MTSDLDRLERQIADACRLLADLPAVTPTAAHVAAVQAAVRRAAMRLRRRGVWLRRARVAAGVAAALVLGVSWAHWSRSGGAGGAPEADLRDWAAALQVSSQRLADELGEAEVGSAEERELDDYFQGMDKSLGIFETL
jgi:hypothetical protein